MIANSLVNSSDRQQVDKRLVNPRRVMPPRVQEVAERVLHGTGRRRDVLVVGRWTMFLPKK
jgi:hypothetical protein